MIIPAYKAEFLGRALDSLSRQTDRRFSVYVGDDGSPQPLEAIVSRYADTLDITYHRFVENVGGRNLGEHWERCIRLMRGETFFCLFSDDDVMEPTCIERFHEELSLHADADVFHFDIDLMDEDERIVKHCAPYPPHLSASAFLRLLYTYQIDARMPEFIFRTSHFLRSGGVVKFDLAYRSDNAVVLVNAWERGIYTIRGPKVLWRDSGFNLSSARNVGLSVRRVHASIDFFNWLETFYSRRGESCPFCLAERLELIVADIVSLKGLVARRSLFAALGRIRRLGRSPCLYLRCRLYLLLALSETPKSRNFCSHIKKYCLTPYRKNK